MIQTRQHPPAPGARIAMKQLAYDQLKRLIMSGELPAGAVLSARQLAVDLNMSKTPVHSAVERLEADGFVTLAPQQGVVVREISAKDIVDQFEMRQALEPFVVRRLAGTLTQEQIERLRDNLSEYRERCDRGDLDGLIRADAEFHQLLCQLLGNNEITRAMSQIQDKVHRAIYRVLKQFPTRATEAYQEHHAILDAMIAGDGQRAAELAGQHLEDGLKRFWTMQR